MTYQELEEIRKRYNEKRAENRKKVFRISTPIYIFIVAMILISNLARMTMLSRFEFTSNLFFIFTITIHYFIWSFVASFIFNAITNGNNYTEYRNAYKNYFISSTFNKIFTDVSYSHSAEMPYGIPSSTGVLYMGDRYSSNDYTVAKYKGIPFAQADVHIEERHRDSDGDVTYSTVFRGRYITFDFKKDFHKKLLVASKNFYGERHDKTFKRIELESTEFNKNFDVYAQDGFEAFYLLDPAVMERIQKLSDLHDGRIMICFSEKKLHIAINDHRDAFEPAPANAPINEKAEFEKVMNDIKVITNIVDEMKLVK
jgi:hypothetical protein